ncbi:MAG: hypothetical protein KKD28_15250 [Chloroflexi bacterium]|nr:hypothetical protein [Chloroflexota bacterium]
MSNKSSLQARTEHDREFGNASPAHSRAPGVLMVVGGLVLILGAPILIWVFRGALAETNPSVLLSLWYGMGGLVLLYMTAGLPLGAILLAAGGARLYSAKRVGRVLLPLLVIQLVFFMFHAVRLMLDWSLLFLLSAFMGSLFVILFLALVWVWAHQRPSLEPQRQWTGDLQLEAGLCFFSAAWQACGFAGAPGFAMYPEIVQKLGNQSFIAGQAFAVQFFIVLGFVFLLLAMRAGRAQNTEPDEQVNKHDAAI